MNINLSAESVGEKWLMAILLIGLLIDLMDLESQPIFPTYETCHRACYPLDVVQVSPAGCVCEAE